MRSFCASIVVFLLACVATWTPVRGEAEKDEGFVSLFNGQTLDGWVGAKEGYSAEDGNLVCVKGHGGNLYTEQEYADFVFRFEFKLEPGSNNGVALRAPLSGDSAYEGMESQILDDGHEKYKGLKEYQVHGSIYGVIPAKRGHLKPVGEWNEEEITLVGSKVKVVLNGEVILEADIKEASKDGTIDGNKHPGLERETGHIGFCGHGDQVIFRNLKIKDLSKKKS